MKKNFQITFKTVLLFLILLIGHLSKAQFSFSLTPNSSTICAGNASNPATNIISCALTGTAPGATYYTFTITPGVSIFGIAWTGTASTLGSTCNISSWCSAPGIYTITGLAYASNTSSVLIASVTNTFLAVNGPTISVAGPSTICPNSINNYTASGANTYTWFGSTGSGSYSINGGAVASMTAGSLATFSVRGTSSNGCVNANVFSPSLGSTSVSVSQNTICAGSSATLTASGAISYTWSNGSNGTSIIVTPTASTVYTLISTNLGCIMTSTHVILVAGTPILTVSPSQNVCSGNSATIVAQGASTYTWLPGNLSGASIVVSPISSSCYTVIASNSGNCIANAVACVSVSASPSITIISSGSVCSGSSITFTASGANTYTWNNSSTGSTLNIVPMSSGVYSVIGSHTLNSCTKLATVSAFVSPSCAIVWPGDANRDGLVSNLDVLELGLASGATGAARSATSNAWAGQFASAWNGTISTGWNKAHADCNGDGIVNSNDNTAITANFGLTHSFKGSNISTNPDITIVPQQAIAFEGIWNKADIILGDASNSITQLYGLAFDINYDQSKVQTDSVGISYTASFLSSNNTNIDFGKTIFTNGKLFCASVRTDHSDVNGNGKIAEFWYKVKTGLPNNSNITISVSNVQKVNASGAFNTLTVDAGALVSISNNLTGLIDENKNMSANVMMHPNPSSKQITLQSTLGKTVTYSISDMIGREVLKGEFSITKQVDISMLENGNYIVRFNSDKQSVTKKLIIIK